MTEYLLLEDVPLSCRAMNCLARALMNKDRVHWDDLEACFKTPLSAVAQFTEVELLSYRGLGETTLKEIKRMLQRHGMSLREPGEDRIHPTICLRLTCNKCNAEHIYDSHWPNMVTCPHCAKKENEDDSRRESGD